MERKCLKKSYVRLSEDMQSTPEVISRIRGDITETMQYLDGKWVDEKNYTCQKISPEQALCHYIKILNGPVEIFKVFECSLCGKEFQFQHKLMRHIPSHTGARNYVCSICQKGFKQQSTLSQHLTTHRTSRPHRCSECSKTFSRTSTLFAHKKTHLKEKIHKCQYCGKGFNQKINLKNHVHTHTGARPFKCDICDKKFNQKSNLNCHKKSAHYGEKATLQIAPSETTSPNPLPLLLPTVLQVKDKEENPSSINTIVTVVKSSPPKHVMEKLLRNETAFVVFIENDFVSPTATILKVIIVEDQYALVRIKKSDYENIDLTWIILRETLDKKNFKMFGYENELIRNQLVFCDDSSGVNINQYIESRSKSKIGEQSERFEFDFHVFDKETNTEDDWHFMKEIEKVPLQCHQLAAESDQVFDKSEETINDSNEFLIDFSSLCEDDDTPITWIPTVYLQQ